MSVRILNANLLSITRIELLQSLKRGVLVTPNLALPATPASSRDL